VGRSFVRVDDKQLAAAPANYRPEEQPVRSSVMGAGAPARFRPPVAVMNRQAVATRMPAAPPRTPFEQARPAMNVRTEPAGVPQPLRAVRTYRRHRQRRATRPSGHHNRNPNPWINQRGVQNQNSNVPRPGNSSAMRPSQPESASRKCRTARR